MACSRVNFTFVYDAALSRLNPHDQKFAHFCHYTIQMDEGLWSYIYSFSSALQLSFTTGMSPVPIWKEVGPQGSFREAAKGNTSAPLDNRTLFSCSAARSLVNILSYAGFTEKEKHLHCIWEMSAALLMHLCSPFQKVRILCMWTIRDIHNGPDPISSLTSLWLPSSFLSCQMDENWNWIQFLFSPRKWLSQ